MELNNGVTYLPGAGEGHVPQWPGTYAGTVVSNHDPLGVGRLQLHVPQVLGNAVSAWAVPAGTYYAIPTNGTPVSVSFLGGDPGQPIWSGPLDLNPLVESAAGPNVTYSSSQPANPKVGDIWYPITLGTIDTVGPAEVWTYDSGTSTYSWVVQPSIGSSAIANGAVTLTQLAAGIVYAGIINGTTVNAATFNGSVFEGTDFEINTSGAFFYSGTPGAGNDPIAWITTGTTDPYGNTVEPQMGSQSGGTGVYLQGSDLRFLGSYYASGGTDAVVYATPATAANQPSTLTILSPADGAVQSILELAGESEDGSVAAYCHLAGIARAGNTGADVDLWIAGKVVATDPATTSGPQAKETWHKITSGFPAGVSGQIAYTLLPDNWVGLDFQLAVTSGTSIGGGTFFASIPSAYYPTAPKMYDVQALEGSNWVPVSFDIDTGGNIHARNAGVTTITQLTGNARYPLGV